ncbi:hypothetical protein KIN34_02160 [Cellulomonas sp. DKR-3]|uniref:Uncharacterized protein n=1 Tax=Cellulomonas fulva TaxID=2835530 RepID=A0ABS5TVG8_9CELL|nr:hypothetical protein [Cellulomonas fulva]MBT0993097.1 hypothetical protein [Cellulomonas fulva]
MTTVPVAAPAPLAAPHARPQHDRASAWQLAAIQVLGAGAALLGWWALGSTASAAAQAPAVRAYGWSSVLALPLTLGVAYLLPNLARGWAAPLRRGPWSPYVTLAWGVSGAAVAVGGVLVVAAALGAPTGVAGLTALAAGAVAAGVMGCQLARLTGRRGLMAGSAVGQALLPVTWWVATVAGMGARSAGLAVLVVAASGLAALVHRTRGLAAPLRRSDLDVRFLRSAAVLVPHLLVFAVLMQGLRLVATGSPADLLAAHLVMLVVTVGATLGGSLHAILAARVQSAPDDELAARAAANARAYALVGAALGLAVAVGAHVAPAFVGAFPRVGVAGLVALATVLPSVMTYYATSGLALRSGRSGVVAASSAAAVAVLLAAQPLVAGGTTSEQAVAYAVAVAVLPVVGACLTAARCPGPVARAVGPVARWGALAPVPGVLAALALAGTGTPWTS